MGKKKDAIAFENEIKNFLIDLEFNDVEGARDNFLINGIQVDVLGGWENALLVIECKTKQSLDIKNLRKDISELRGKIEILEKGFNEHPLYSKYSYFKYIIATKNIEIRQEDISFANNGKQIYIWSNDFFEYYKDLYTFIKPYAKYDLLGEMHIKPISRHTITVPAFRTAINGKNIYNFIMNPRDLLEIAFVARRDVGKERYYQRIINKERLIRIKTYIELGGTFPNNIIVAFNPDIKLNYIIQKGYHHSLTDWPYFNTAFGILEFPKDYRSCWIIDGQHRLYAFVNIENKYDFNMPITAFENLDVKEQRKYFLDINKNQKPVDPDLLWDLSGDIPNEKEGRISNTVKKYLNSDKDSPLKNRIYYPTTGIKNKTERIKISALCIALKKRKILDEYTSLNIRNALYDSDQEKHIKKVGYSLILFFKTLHKLFVNNWSKGSKGFILTNGGISVLLGIFEKILSRIMQKENRIPDKHNFEYYLNPLKERLEVNDEKKLKDLRIRCSSEGGKSDVLNDFIIHIRNITKDEKFGGEIYTIKFDEEFKEIEKLTKEFIKKNLFDENDQNWFRNNIDQSVYHQAKKNLDKNNLSTDKLYLQITLGQAFGIIRNKPYICDKLIGDKKFANRTQLLSCFDTISPIRAKLTAHHTGADEIEDDQMDMLKINMKILKKGLEEQLS